ncbi:BglG family transcription antiterminator [Microbacterium sp. NPDC055683]
MSRQRQDRLVAILLRDGGWMTAAALSDVLGVTPRSIRSYVTAVNGRVPGHPVIASGPAGYRAHPTGAALLKEAGASAPGTPRDRLHRLIHALIDADDGIDVHDTAAALHVSEATLEGDLSRVRALVRTGADLALERTGPRVVLAGSELARRRLLSSLAHDEMDDGAFDVEALRRVVGATTVSAGAFGRFKGELAAELGALGYFVNEFAVADAALHASIAVDRALQGRSLDAVRGDPEAEHERLAEVVGRLAESAFGVALGRGDRLHLASLLLTRVVVPGTAQAGAGGIDPAVESAVRAAVSRVSREYLVALDGEEFALRLALHVQNLALRAREQAWSRNPLTRSIKATYPMIFEVAVSIAGDLSERLGMAIRDDEIAYIAMHVGGELERARAGGTRLTATIVCPGYYELHELLRSSIARSLGGAVEVVEVVTRVDPDWRGIDSDLVLTTIEPPTPSERIVRIRPFLTEADVDRVQQAAARLRRARRLARLRTELERYFDAETFVRGIEGDEESVIRRLGALLVERGVIDDGYVDGAIERERMSSTAFTDALAVPHAMRMTARRTAIAIGIAESPIAWGDSRVQVVAFAAFSESDREAFQTVFEQFVEVFGERDDVQRIIRRGTDFAGFLDELVAIIGS